MVIVSPSAVRETPTAEAERPEHKATQRLSPDTLRRLAWVAFGFSLLIFLAVLPFVATAPEIIDPSSWAAGTPGDVLLNVMIMALPTVGVLIARRQPTNRVAWLLLGIGVIGTLGSTGDAYASYGLVRDPGSLPGADVVAALCAGSWVAPLGLIGTFLILLYPDGHLPSPRWRPLAWIAALLIVALTVMLPLTPGPLPDTSLPVSDNPLGIEAWESVLRLNPFVSIALILCIPISALALVSRFRRATGVARLQLKWLATAGAAVAGFALVTEVTRQIAVANKTPQSDLGWLLALEYGFFLSLLLVPAAIGVAILKHGLYGIDVVINKALVFGSLAVFITGVYVAIVVGIGAAIGQGNRSLPLSIAATAIVAIAFQPVRERVQRLANRLVYGARSTPYELLSEFAERMGGAYPAAELLPQMARTVGEGMGAARVDVWLKIGAELVREVSWPAAAPDGSLLVAVATGTDEELPPLGGDRVVPVRHHGELLGAIAVTKKPGEQVTPTEAKLMDDVGAQAGLVLRNVGLIEELRGSRERLVRTQDTERRRLERNLHDGAQQSLVSVALLLRITRNQLGADADRVAASLDEASDQLKTAIDELRELARGIHPALLSQRGLGPAISSLAERSPIPVTTDVQLPGRLSETVEATAYYVIAEALTNTAKYAQASAVTISAAVSDGALVATITDDGIGGADSSRGSGLTGLADRVAAADGSLDIVSPPGHGTRLRCSIPLQPARTEVEAPTSGYGAAVVGAAAGAAAGGGSHG